MALSPLRQGAMPTSHHPFAGMDLASLLEARSSFYGDKTFLIWQGYDEETERVSYRQMQALAAGFSRWMMANGLRAGDRVLLVADNSPEFLITLFGCAIAGVTCVPINTRSTDTELSNYVARIDPSLIVIQARFAHSIQAHTSCDAKTLVIRRGDRGERLAPDDKNASFPALNTSSDPMPPCNRTAADPERLAVVLFTSGTSSAPKGVCLTHANLLWGARLSALHETLAESDRSYIFLPLFHVNALVYGVLAALWAGSSVVLSPRFSASRFWAISIRHNCTWANQTGFTYRALMKRPVPARHSYRIWGNGASDLPHDTAFRIRSLGWYGMTETVSHPIIGSPNGPNVPLTIGRPSPGYRVDIVDEAGGPVPAGVAGHLRVVGIPGLSLFSHYLDDPIATRDAFDSEGRFITGDIVEATHEGAIRFVERAGDALKVGGENVSSREIEQVISEVSGVSEVAVVGGPHPMLDEVPVAFVIRDGAQADEATVREAIRARCEKCLSDFKRPRTIRFLQRFPVATLGKTAKAQLRIWAALPDDAFDPDTSS
ncbi:MAG: AMP-binding protein [Pseudomonadota bacterium]